MNDPIAVLLVLGFIEWELHPGYGVADMLLLFVQQLGIGLVAGVAVGRLSRWAFQRMRFSSPGLYPVASLAAAALSFGSAAALHGSGFLAVYLTGLALGTGNLPAKRTVTAFHEGLAWVAQLGMFLTLGLLVFPSRARRGRREGHAARAARRLRRAAARDRDLARRRAASACERQALLGWAGLRGAVPVVLATFPILDGIPRVGRVLQHRLLRRAALDASSRAPRSSPSRAGWG